MSGETGTVKPQDNYKPAGTFGYDLEKAQFRVALYGVPQMVHSHAQGEECNLACYGVILP